MNKFILVLCSLAIFATIFIFGCTQESQNKLNRRIQNWTGTDGVLDIYAGDKLVNRFIKIDKISTAYGTDERTPRSYRFGYGYLDLNQNYKVDSGEKKFILNLVIIRPVIFFMKILTDVFSLQSSSFVTHFHGKLQLPVR